MILSCIERLLKMERNRSILVLKVEANPLVAEEALSHSKLALLSVGLKIVAVDL